MSRRAVALALLLATASPAAALELTDDALSDPAIPPEHWYGWQIFLVDVASMGTVLVPRVGPYVGGLGLALGSALVHTAHGRHRPALASLGMRLGPVAAGIVLDNLADLHGDGVLLGVAAAYLCGIADVALLAWEPVERGPPVIAPAVQTSALGTTVGFALRF